MLSLVAAGLTLISMTAPMSVYLHFICIDPSAYPTSKDGSIATAIFQTSCRIGYALGLAVATLIQENVESQALRGGAGRYRAHIVAALVILFGMRGWQMLSEMKQGGEESQESEDCTAIPRAHASA
jgi:hypothetical protein